jgi:predicted transcriptional regulator
MKVTISLDDDLVNKVRKIAVDRDTTLTGLIQEHLRSLAAADAVSGRKRREQRALERSFEQFRFKVGKRTWKRGVL